MIFPEEPPEQVRGPGLRLAGAERRQKHLPPQFLRRGRFFAAAGAPANLRPGIDPAREAPPEKSSQRLSS